MTFSTRASDINSVVAYAKRLYRTCREVGGAYDEVSREVRGLYTVLRHLEFEIDDAESLLNRHAAVYTRDLTDLIADCGYALQQLDDLLQRHGQRAAAAAASTSPCRRGDLQRWASTEMDQLGELRMKLINHKTTVTALLDAVQLREAARTHLTLQNHTGQLDRILDKVDAIAARMDQGTGSLSSYEDDDKAVWKQFRRELVAEGFASDVLQKHKDVLRAYIREVDQKGLLHDSPPDADSPVRPSVDTERWLKGVEADSHRSLPACTEIVKSPLEDPGLHVVDLENTRSQPGSADYFDRIGAASADSSLARQPRPAGNQTMATPSLQLNGSSLHPSSIRLAIEDAPVISTTELILADRAAASATSGWQPVPHLPASPEPSNPAEMSRMLSRASLSNGPSPPSSFDETKKQVRFADKNSDCTASPTNSQPDVYRSSAQSAPIPIPGAAPLNQSVPAPPRTSCLAPDSKGYPIPPDAKWTRIKRSLLSLEVLNQDGLRYEARPEFVAILGVLSREEVLGLAVRSHAVREARMARRKPADLPPAKPPRPRQSTANLRLSSPETSSDSESSGRDARCPTYDSRYRYGPSTLKHTTSSSGLNSARQPPEHASSYPAPSSSRRSAHRPRESSSYDHHRRRSHRPSAPRNDASTHDARRSASRHRWRDNFTAASIGSAAVSLLSVLSEAGEHL